MPTRLEPSSDDPLARPPPSQTCAENDDRSSVGRGVMARSDDDGRTFSRRKNGMLQGGALYAPFVLNRYTTAAAGGGSTIYWLVSTWNPYEVTVMRTTLKRDSR